MRGRYSGAWRATESTRRDAEDSTHRSMEHRSVCRLYPDIGKISLGWVSYPLVRRGQQGGAIIKGSRSQLFQLAKRGSWCAALGCRIELHAIDLLGELLRP